MSARKLSCVLATGLMAASAGPLPAHAQTPVPPERRGTPVMAPANPEMQRSLDAQGAAFSIYQKCVADNRKGVDLYYAAQSVIEIRDRRPMIEATFKMDPRTRQQYPGGVDQMMAQAFAHYKSLGGPAAAIAQVQPVPTPCPPPAPERPPRPVGSGTAAITESRQYVIPPSGALPAPPAAPATSVTLDLQTQDPVKQVEIGILYRYGRVPVERDPKEAARWFQKAVAQGHAPAMNAMGDLYNLGAPGLPRDALEASKWYRQAADKGYADAMASLGDLHSSNKSSALWKDDAEAVRWYRMAAERGHVLAMHNVARAYQTGKGVAVDKKEALNWYRKAAERGNAVSDSWVKIADNCAKVGRPLATCL